jgi:hypothetical protein
MSRKVDEMKRRTVFQACNAYIRSIDLKKEYLMEDHADAKIINLHRQRKAFAALHSAGFASSEGPDEPSVVQGKAESRKTKASNRKIQLLPFSGTDRELTLKEIERER